MTKPDEGPRNVTRQAYSVNAAERARRTFQEPVVLWFTGLSGAGKSTIANVLDIRLHADGRHAFVLDGDNVRHGLCSDLGFSEEDRVENIRRVSEVARLMTEAGLIVIVCLISPFRAERERARALFPEGRFIEVFIDTPLGECVARDPKGLYRKALAGEIPNFTGVSVRYEKPETPEITIRTTECDPEAAVSFILAHLAKRQALDLDAKDDYPRASNGR